MYTFLPPCTHTHTVVECFSYIRLKSMVSRFPDLLNIATQHLLSLLNKEVSHTHDYGDREVLLPLLHLFQEFLTMVCQLTLVNSPWPVDQLKQRHFMLLLTKYILVNKYAQLAPLIGLYSPYPDRIPWPVLSDNLWSCQTLTAVRPLIP